jgi:hypothetical protein
MLHCNTATLKNVRFGRVYNYDLLSFEAFTILAASLFKIPAEILPFHTSAIMGLLQNIYILVTIKDFYQWDN